MVEAVVPSDGDFVLMVAICLVIVMIPFVWSLVVLGLCVDKGLY